MKSTLIHFDSLYSSYTLPNNDPSNAKYELPSPLNNVETIKLKSVELPVNFYNIRSTPSNSMVQLRLTTNTGTTYGITIAGGNYTSISSLLTAINNAFIGVIPSTTVTFALYGNTNKVNCTLVSSTVTSFILQDTILSKYILGFRNVTYSGLSNTGSTDYCLNIDNYVTMFLYNVPAENCTAGSLLTSFKIPLNATYGNIYFMADNNSFEQYVSLLKSRQTINYIQVQLYDRFGNLITNNCDFSFSLEFTIDQHAFN